jgi:regulator-associated protein of mTOR
MTALTMRPKGPQPVLDSLTDAAEESDAQAENQARPRTAPRLDTPTNGFSLHRSSTQILLENNNGSRRASRNASPADIATRRPGLLRAKSDFGPRREEAVRGEDESKTSDGGEWGIRHGFETQLVSEEYNQVLNAVRPLFTSTLGHD